jgi:hypothetical protein
MFFKGFRRMFLIRFCPDRGDNKRRKIYDNKMSNRKEGEEEGTGLRTAKYRKAMTKQISGKMLLHMHDGVQGREILWTIVHVCSLGCSGLNHLIVSPL